MVKSFLLFLIAIQITLFAKPIETFYGTIEVTEPVLIEVIESKPMQRLKGVHQYGVSYYTTHKEEYSRYDHSLGVFTILRLKGASVHEQLAGLLHDVSHTIFSHVGDYAFNPSCPMESYQDDVHGWFLQKYGIAEILKKYDITIEQINPKSGKFLALEQELPNLCADRIDYNLQGSYFQGFLTKAEIKEILDDLQFVNGKWISSKPDLMKKMVRFSLHMTKHCWGSADNFLMSKWLADVIHRAVHLGKISHDDIHFGEDKAIWEKLNEIPDGVIQNLFVKIFNAQEQYALVKKEEADLTPKMKFRGFDPWIKQGDKIVRLTELDPEFAKEFYQIKGEMEQGWSIKLKK
ncbi:MAG: HD domain-containing protein [Verrucomicrobia bacterium]|nr:HD domain-containing protein [Verrucomicrobiota bacterium]